MLHLTLSLLTLVTLALCAPEKMPDHEQHEAGAGLDAPVHMHEVLDDQRLEKRSPAYDFGLGKRAYSYVSEYKRLPVYNFGLGKRSRLYSFGLGKRSVDASDAADADSWEPEPTQQELLADLLDRYEQYDDEVTESKRAVPYSFGLGKRYADNDATDKRARLYEFGLGKRAPLYNFGLGKRLNPGRTYSFGLGKRLSPGRTYSFGLGKRQRDLNRFNFGLGKRSADDTDLEAEADA